MRGQESGPGGALTARAPLRHWPQAHAPPTWPQASAPTSQPALQAPLCVCKWWCYWAADATQRGAPARRTRHCAGCSKRVLTPRVCEGGPAPPRHRQTPPRPPQLLGEYPAALARTFCFQGGRGSWCLAAPAPNGRQLCCRHRRCCCSRAPSPRPTEHSKETVSCCAFQASHAAMPQCCRTRPRLQHQGPRAGPACTAQPAARLACKCVYACRGVRRNECVACCLLASVHSTRQALGCCCCSCCSAGAHPACHQWGLGRRLLQHPRATPPRHTAGQPVTLVTQPQHAQL